MHYDEYQKKIDDRKRELKAFCSEILTGRFPFTLEIGCGHGHWLTAYAETYPNEFCVGIDIIGHRIAKSELKRKNCSAQNLVFCRAESMEFIQSIPRTVKLKQVFILFPDPWPKTRHYKNRLIQVEFLDQLAAVMDKESRLYFRTDHNDYFKWASKKIQQHSAWELDRRYEWPFEKETYFQMIHPSYYSLSAQAIPIN